LPNASRPRPPGRRRRRTWAATPDPPAAAAGYTLTDEDPLPSPPGGPADGGRMRGSRGAASGFRQPLRAGLRGIHGARRAGTGAAGPGRRLERERQPERLAPGLDARALGSG